MLINTFKKKPFNFMQWALGPPPGPPPVSRYPTHLSISYSFLDMSLISRYVTHFSISLHRGFVPGWTVGVSPGVWERLVAGCLGDSSGRVSDKPWWQGIRQTLVARYPTNPNNKYKKDMKSIIYYVKVLNNIIKQ